MVTPTAFYPAFASQLYFVHLNKKQSSKEAIYRYRTLNKNKNDTITVLSDITREIISTTRLGDFELLLKKHEIYIANLIQHPRIQDEVFPDYFGTIKSLGAWGGDFILVTGNTKTPAYFKEKGFTTILPYDRMVRHYKHNGS